MFGIKKHCKMQCFLLFSWIFDICLCSSKSCDWDSEWRARNIVSPALWQNSTLDGSPPCSPQIPSLMSGLVAFPRSAAIFTSLPTPFWSSLANGSLSKIFFVIINIKEFCSIVTAESVCHLSEVVCSK